MPAYDTKTALVVVDVQNDFADPSGNLYVREAEAALERVNEEIHAAAQAAALVVYTQDWHPATTPHFEKDGGTWPTHCVGGTWGARLHPELLVQGEVVRKGTGGEDGYSGFAVRDPGSGEEKRTSLEGILRERHIERTVVVGLATDYCVKATAMDALAMGFDTFVVRDATRAVDLEPGDGDRAIQAVREAGGAIE